MILAKGVSNVDFSTMKPELRSKVLDEVGEALMKRGEHEQAAKAFSIAGSPKVREMSNYFLQHGLASVAAAYAQHLESHSDRSFVEEVATRNLHEGNPVHAKRLFHKTGNETMVKFIEENFPE